jgi:hypothetical protein
MQDVPTRWNSTNNMLTRFIEQKKSIDIMAIDDKSIEKAMKMLSDQELTIIDRLCKILSHFETATKMVCFYI